MIIHCFAKAPNSSLSWIRISSWRARLPTGEEGVELARQLNPDLVLLDLNMRGMDGISVLKELKANRHESVVIMLTVSDSENDIVAALRCGADGYLLKDMEPEEILIKLRRAIGGQTVLDESISTLLANVLRNENRSPPSESD